MFLGGNRCLVPLVLTLFINASTRFVYYACIGPLWSSIFYAEYIATPIPRHREAKTEMDLEISLDIKACSIDVFRTYRINGN